MELMTTVVVYIFFFKQKTAYEMRISDWSSDVCSSDLGLLDVARNNPALLHARCRCPTRQAVRRPRLDRQPRLRADPPDIRHARRTVAHDPPHDAGARRNCAREDRSEEGSVGKEWGNTCRSGWSPTD